MYRPSNSQGGVSLIELLIVLVVIAIIVTFAVSRFGSTNKKIDRQKVARELKVNLERARFDSIKRRATVESEMSGVIIESPTSFTISRDLNQDGILDPAETRLVDFSNYDLSLLAKNVQFPVSIMFDELGQTIVTDGSGKYTDPVFTICNGDCATVSTNNANIIVVSPTGTVAMLSGEEALPTYSNPNISTVLPTSGVEPRATHISQNGITPLATPTPSPTASPSPSPGIRACQSDEKPATTGCVCQLPMTIGFDGKCRRR